MPLLLPGVVHLMPHAAIDGVLAFVGAEGDLETRTLIHNAYPNPNPNPNSNPNPNPNLTATPTPTPNPTQLQAMAAATPGLSDAPPQSVRVLHRVYFCCKLAWCKTKSGGWPCKRCGQPTTSPPLPSPTLGLWWRLRPSQVRTPLCQVRASLCQVRAPPCVGATALCESFGDCSKLTLPLRRLSLCLPFDYSGAGHTTEVMVDTIITAKRPSGAGTDDAGFVMSSRCALPYQAAPAHV